MLTVFLTLIHVIVCFFLIIVVLLQSGKAADLAGAFGGMGSQTTFGPRGSATVLSKATTAAAVIFMITSMWLAILATRHAASGGSSVLDRAGKATKPPATAPARPGAQPVAPVTQQAAPGQAPKPNIEVQQVQPGAKPVTIPQNANQPAPAKKK
ncbi:MAG TPA: preprotein translocase subunit SecG [Bryobacteraceae bacterium]|nr:preprotein translocase subunit SecG [Bryobacteraceae bacterium]